MRLIYTILVFAFVCTAAVAQDAPDALSPEQQKEFLGQRTSGILMGAFADYAGLLNMMGPVAIGTDDEKVAGTGLQALYPDWYEPTWGQLLTSVARQTRSAFAYDSKRRLFLFNPPAMPLPYTVTIAKGWKAEDRGLYVSYIPEIAPVGMDIYMMGEFSAQNNQKISEILSKAKEDASIVFARNFKKDAAVKDMTRVKVAGDEALHFRAAAPSGRNWRQWIFTADNQVFGIVSTIDPENEDRLLPDGEAMIRSFKAGTASVMEPKDQVYKLRMSLDDTFILKDTDEWKVTVLKEMPLRIAVVRVEPKKGSDFSLQLNFLCDTKDLAKFDTEEKMKRAFLESCQGIVPESVEGKIDSKDLSANGRYGWSSFFTDKSLVGKKELEPGKYRYLTQGMIRLSDDSAMAFTLLTNAKQDSPEYTKVITYIQSFVKKKK